MRAKEAGRLGGIRSQQVQREKRMELHKDDPVYPARPRWSVGIRDNWSGESGWFEFRSMRDVIRKIHIALKIEVEIKPCKNQLER